VTVITEHYCEQEWEGYDSEGCGVSLLVRRNTVSVGDKLKRSNHIVGLEVGWGHQLVLGTRVTAPCLEFSCLEHSETILNLSLKKARGPKETNIIV